jgi:hypothetical protein
MGGQRIKVWENANRTGDIVLPKTWNAGATIPGTLYVEGITNSATARDVELRLEYDENPQGQSNPLFKCEDRVRLTVVKMVRCYGIDTAKLGRVAEMLAGRIEHKARRGARVPL